MATADKSSGQIPGQKMENKTVDQLKADVAMREEEVRRKDRKIRMLMEDVQHLLNHPSLKPFVGTTTYAFTRAELGIQDSPGQEKINMNLLDIRRRAIITQGRYIKIGRAHV